MFRGFVFALIASVALSSSVMAGGNNGGTKKDATFRIINDLSTAIAVVIDPTTDFIAKANAGTATLTDLNNAGGKIIEPGKNASFKVKAGTHQIGHASVNSSTGAIGAIGGVTRTVGKGKTVTYNASAL